MCARARACVCVCSLHVWWRHKWCHCARILSTQAFVTWTGAPIRSDSFDYQSKMWPHVTASICQTLCCYQLLHRAHFWKIWTYWNHSSLTIKKVLLLNKYVQLWIVNDVLMKNGRGDRRIVEKRRSCYGTKRKRPLRSKIGRFLNKTPKITKRLAQWWSFSWPKITIVMNF